MLHTHTIINVEIDRQTNQMGRCRRTSNTFIYLHASKTRCYYNRIVTTMKADSLHLLRYELQVIKLLCIGCIIEIVRKSKGRTCKLCLCEIDCHNPTKLGVISLDCLKFAYRLRLQKIRSRKTPFQKQNEME